jgi:signal transduction histidine kinase
MFYISVQDKGIGIEQKYIEKLFEPFYQVESGKLGLGLGLHITKSIVKFHKGTISVESKVHKGSTFYVSIPANYRLGDSQLHKKNVIIKGNTLSLFSSLKSDIVAKIHLNFFT